MYLNVNGFFGDSDKEKIMNENKDQSGKVSIEEVRRKQQDKYKDSSEDIIKEIETICEHSKIVFDLIFLSEVDPNSPATINFVDKIKKIEIKYEVLPPFNTELKNLNGSSCTLCLKRQGVEYTNKNNGFTKNDYLHFCKIINEDTCKIIMKNTVLLGIHWAAIIGKTEKNTEEENWKRTTEFIQSLKRLMPNDLDNTNVLLFGDTNANPDVDFKCLENKDKFLTNCLIEYVMKSSGLVEVCPNPMEKTTKFRNKGTRIDRVFTNIPIERVKVEVQRSFLDKELSDHAALIITLE